MHRLLYVLVLCSLLGFSPLSLATSAACKSRFINPITDICWDCLFPMTVGSATVLPSRYPDTNNPSMPISYCPKPPPIYMQIGVNIGYWEPYALTDVTRVPYCMVNMGTQMSGANSQK
ncbi:TraU family protein, partial [Vibrio sinaloensis]|uniref:TraU family protein n=1 Tax=Photobacterium sp. (strain ATCC 43367) TaxID=379097 RepID=UPI0035E642BD